MWPGSVHYCYCCYAPFNLLDASARAWRVRFETTNYNGISAFVNVSVPCSLVRPFCLWYNSVHVCELDGTYKERMNGSGNDR